MWVLGIAEAIPEELPYVSILRHAMDHGDIAGARAVHVNIRLAALHLNIVLSVRILVLVLTFSQLSSGTVFP